MDKNSKYIKIPVKFYWTDYKNELNYRRNSTNPTKCSICHEDFFKEVGILPLIQEMRKENEWEKYHSDNIRASEFTCNAIYRQLEQNLVCSKNKYSDIYKKTKLQSMISWDHLMFSPRTDNSLHDHWIQVLKPSHKFYKKVTKEML